MLIPGKPCWQSTKISADPASRTRRLQEGPATTVGRGVHAEQLTDGKIRRNALLDDALQDGQTSHGIEEGVVPVQFPAKGADVALQAERGGNLAQTVP